VSQTLKIAVIAKGSVHSYWKSVHAGVIKAERDLLDQGINIQVIWDAPFREGALDEHVKMIERFTQQGVSGIVLAPFDSRALASPVEAAHQRGIPTVVIDSPLDSPHVVSLVGTDNRKGGELAADLIGQHLGGQGTVLVLRYQEGSTSTEEREQGFIQRLRRFSSLEVIASDCCVGATRDTARRASETLLARYPNLQGIFTPNEPATAGMLMALVSIRQAGKISFVGFDSSDIYIDRLRSRFIRGLVVQNPLRIGELGVKTLVEHIHGVSVSRRVDTGATMVTPDNMDEPEIRQLLNPQIA